MADDLLQWLSRVISVKRFFDQKHVVWGSACGESYVSFVRGRIKTNAAHHNQYSSWCESYITVQNKRLYQLLTDIHSADMCHTINNTLEKTKNETFDKKRQQFPKKTHRSLQEKA